MTGPGRQRTLEGMPLAPGDMFVCVIGDADEWAGRRRAPRGSAPATEPLHEVWLVLRSCGLCQPRKYCWRHWPLTDAERARKGERSARWA